MQNKQENLDGWPDDWHIPGYSDLFPRTAKIVRFILRMPNQLASHGDNFQNSGGGPMLDRELYTVRQCPDISDDALIIGINQMFHQDELDLE